MNRSILSTLGLAAFLSAAALSDPDPASAPTARRPEPVADVSCKPLAPIDVRLTQTEATGNVVRLAFEVRPLREVRDVTYELELPDDATLLEGERIGAAIGLRGAVTRGEARLAMPVDDLYRRARLHVHAVMTGADEFGNPIDEPIAVVRTLGWGTPEPVGPTAMTPDAETGELEPVVVLPTAHRPGR